MALSRDDVEKIAFLARLSLTESELDAMTTQLGQIVSMVDKLQAINTNGVEPLVHAIELQNVLAEDVLRPSIDRKDALRNAPCADAECFRVPAVL